MKNRLVLLFALLAISIAKISAQTLPLLVGSYTPAQAGDSVQGVFQIHFNLGTGEFSEPVPISAGINPSFLAHHPHLPIVYVANELHGTPPRGVIQALATDPKGTFQLLGKTPTQGNDPCHVAVSADGLFLAAANYSSGSITWIPLRHDGSPDSDNTIVLAHQGNGPSPRQTEPHAHQVVFSPLDSVLYACDLGTDAVMVYRIHNSAPKLTQQLKLAPGSGPRHLTIWPGKRRIYILNELNGSIDVVRIQPKTGTLKSIQTIPSPNKNADANPASADIHLTPDGKFLFVSNRGIENNLVSFKVHPRTGKLALLQTTSCQGKGPRNFFITPDGRWILVANQHSNQVVSFRLDAQSGLLTPGSARVDLHAPVCIVAIP